MFLSSLGTMTPKCMQSTLFRVSKRHYKKLVICVFLSVLGIKTLKSIENNLYGKQHYQKRVLSGFFGILTYQNAKAHVKHPLWRNRTTLPKTYDVGFFQHVRYQNAKMHVNQPIWGNETILKGTCIMSVFQLMY